MRLSLLIVPSLVWVSSQPCVSRLSSSADSCCAGRFGSDNPAGPAPRVGPGSGIKALPCTSVFVFPAHIVKVSRARTVTLAQKPQDSSLLGSSVSGPFQEDLTTKGTT